MAIQRSRAFTLLELMITVSVLAILLSLGVPAFQQYTRKQAMSAAVHALHSDLLLARSQAIYETVPMVACPGTPATGCTGLTDWSNGWIVFADVNEDRAYQVSESLVRHGPGADKIIVRGSAGRTTIRFYPNGSTPGSNGSISFCGPGGPEQARKLVISNLGRIRRDDAPTLNESYCP